MDVTIENHIHIFKVAFNVLERLDTVVRLSSHPTVEVGVAVVGYTNNIPVRLSSSRNELAVSH